LAILIDVSGIHCVDVFRPVEGRGLPHRRSRIAGLHGGLEVELADGEPLVLEIFPGGEINTKPSATVDAVKKYVHALAAIPAIDIRDKKVHRIIEVDRDIFVIENIMNGERNSVEHEDKGSN